MSSNSIHMILKGHSHMEHRRALTLIEILIIFGVLAIFAAVLAPVFLRARESGHGHRSCQSNLKQITLAFKQYVLDYNERFPPYNVGGVGTSTSGNFTANYWVQSLQSYAKTVQLFQCPSDWDQRGTDFYYSRKVSQAFEYKINYSANSILLAEGPDTADASQATATAPITVGTPPCYARHLDGSYYAFVDGHVKWLSSNRAPTTEPASKGGFTFAT